MSPELLHLSDIDPVVLFWTLAVPLITQSDPGSENFAVWLYAELDAWARRRNHNAPRKDKNKFLSHGIPAIIRAKPRGFNLLDFKVC
jgi:hypothetical protein